MDQRRWLPCLVHVCLDVKPCLAINLISGKRDKMAGAAHGLTQAYALWQPTIITCICYRQHDALHLAFNGWTGSNSEQRLWPRIPRQTEPKSMSRVVLRLC